MTETQVQRGTAEQTILYCQVHPTVATTLRCNRCGRPMCTRCAVRTPVGYRCRECVRGQQQVFYTAKPTDLLVQGALGLALGGGAAAAASLLFGALGFGLGFIGWLVAFWAGSAVGAAIADLSYRAVRRRRGRYAWLVVAGCIGAGGLLAGLFLGLGLTNLIFLVMAVSGAAGRLRLGR